MAGDTSNPRIWLNADVYTAPLGNTPPTNVTTAWATVDPAWEAIGLLSQDDGMTETRDQDQTDHYAWGNILVRTTRSKIKYTFQVTALEDNEAVYGLVYPGSTALTQLGITTRTIRVPTVDRRMFGFEFRDGTITKRRIIHSGEVSEVGDIAINDNEMAGVQLTVAVYPDGNGVVWTDVTNDPQAVTAS